MVDAIAPILGMLLPINSQSSSYRLWSYAREMAIFLLFGNLARARNRALSNTLVADHFLASFWLPPRAASAGVLCVGVQLGFLNADALAVQLLRQDALSFACAIFSPANYLFANMHSKAVVTYVVINSGFSSEFRINCIEGDNDLRCPLPLRLVHNVLVYFQIINLPRIVGIACFPIQFSEEMPS